MFKNKKRLVVSGEKNKKKEPKYASLNPKVSAHRRVKLPHKLKTLPDINPKCLLSIKTIKIPGEPYPYNASILEYDEDSYLLFFRTDSRQKKDRITTGLGYIHLDSKFRPTTDYCRYINTKSNYAEDPRIFYHGTRLMLTYNDLVSKVPNIFAISYESS